MLHFDANAIGIVYTNWANIGRCDRCPVNVSYQEDMMLKAPYTSFTAAVATTGITTTATATAATAITTTTIH